MNSIKSHVVTRMVASAGTMTVLIAVVEAGRKWVAN